MVVLLQIWVCQKKMEMKLNNSLLFFFLSKFWAGLLSINPFLNIYTIILLGTAPAGFAQQCPMCNNSSSEVCRLNFVTWEGGRPWNEENEETLFPVIYLGRAAENDVGQETSDRDMRKMRRPYDQSSFLGRPASKR